MTINSRGIYRIKPDMLHESGKSSDLWYERTELLELLHGEYTDSPVLVGA